VRGGTAGGDACGVPGMMIGGKIMAYTITNMLVIIQ